MMPELVGVRVDNLIQWLFEEGDLEKFIIL